MALQVLVENVDEEYSGKKVQSTSMSYLSR